MLPKDRHQNAVGNARRTLGLATDEPVRVWEVRRLKADDAHYLLVVFGSQQRSSGVAAVDPATGAVLQSARLPAQAPHNVMSAAQAVNRAGFPADSHTQLVWEATPASRSRFYPLWQIEHAGRRVWVDAIRGVVWDTLGESERGGKGRHGR
jgi:hypothetical protein